MNITKCDLCPRLCAIDRKKTRGFCGAGELVKVACAMLHKWEEPCVSGQNGAETVFFSHCNLRCVYCQNYEISHKDNGKEISVNRLAEIFSELQDKGAQTLDLVTPTHFIPQIKEALLIAKNRGLYIPVVYNTGGYERAEIIKEIAPLVDVFMPDFKYYSNELSKKYSSADNYVEIAKDAIKAMYEAKGKFKIENGIMTKGVLVRHLVLPGHRKDSMQILKYLYDTFGDNIYLSIMRQYTPTSNAPKELQRKLTTFEYESVVNYAIDLGFKHAYTQEKTAATEDFIPVFNGDGV